MKYLAILKDSVREALDSKVLYFTVGLSCLVILAVASVSFKPEPAEKGLGTILASLPGGKAGFGMPKAPLQYEVENFRQLNDASRPWEREYAFNLVVKEQEAGVFKLFVWVSHLQNLSGDEETLRPEDREARKRLLKLQREAAEVPREKLEEFLNERMRQEIAQ